MGLGAFREMGKVSPCCESGQLFRQLTSMAPSALHPSLSSALCRCPSRALIQKINVFNFLPCSKTSDSPQAATHKDLCWLHPAFRSLKSLPEELRHPFSLPQSMCIFSGFKEARKNVLIFLDRRCAVFSRLLISKSEQTVLPFYPSSLPQCGFLVSLQMKPSVRHCEMKGTVFELPVTEPIKDLTF